MNGKNEASIDRIATIRRMFEESEETDIFSPNAVSHKPWDMAAKRVASSLDESERAVFDPKQMIPDARINVEDVIEDGDKVVVRWRLRGTWSKPFAGIEPTGKRLNITGISTYRFVGSRIVEENGELDFASLSQQAGMSPEACVSALSMFSRPPEVILFSEPKNLEPKNSQPTK